MTRGRYAYYLHVASHSRHLENFVRTRFPDLPAANGIKEQIVIWLDRRRDTRHLPEIRGHTAQDGIIINNVLPRIPMWLTGFLNIST